jgi:single-stranded DNA-binding protein
MAKIGLNLKIDVTKIDKSKMFKGQKGTYLDATIFVDLDNEDQHGNHGMITQAWKDAPKGQTPILGNGKIFWRDGLDSPQQQQSAPNQQQSPQNQNGEPDFDFDDDIPFAPIGLQYRGILNAM